MSYIEKETSDEEDIQIGQAYSEDAESSRYHWYVILVSIRKLVKGVKHEIPGVILITTS